MMAWSRRLLVVTGVLAGTVLHAWSGGAAIDWQRQLAGKALVMATSSVQGQQETHVETVYSLCADGSARLDTRTAVASLGPQARSTATQHNRQTGRWQVDGDTLVLEFDGAPVWMRLAEAAGTMTLDGKAITEIQPADCRLD